METEEYEYDGDAPRFWLSSRFALAVLGFVGFLSMSAQRTCMKVAIVCMLNQTALAAIDERSDLANRPGKTSSYSSSFHEGGPLADEGDLRPGYRDNSTNGAGSGRGGGDGRGNLEEGKVCVGLPEFIMLNTSEFVDLWRYGEFAWSSGRQRAVFDTFSWGFIVANVPAGWLALRFGGKRVFGGFLLTGSLSTALIPIASRTHFYLLLLLRFLGGVGSGGAFPAMHTLWGKWAPPLERSLLASVTYAGSLTGSVFIYPVAGLLCKYGFDGKGFDGGWPSIFYIFGALGIVWFVLWIVFASESPAVHGRISEEERAYIEETLMSETALEQEENRLLIPWSKILTSFPFAAIVLCNFTYEWGVFTFERLFHDFMKTVLHLIMKWNDGLSLLPYFGLWFVVIASGGAADRLQSHGVLKTGTTRKVMQVIGAVVPASMVAAMGFIDCGQWQGPICLLSIGLSFCGFQYNGFLVNHLDLAPRYAGILMGIANAIGSTASFFVPFLFDVMSDVAQSVPEHWQTMFLLTSTFYLSSTVFFLVCGSGELQDWAIIDPTDPTDTLKEQSPFSLYPLDVVAAPAKAPHYAKEISTVCGPSIVGFNAKIPDIYAVDTLRRPVEDAEPPKGPRAPLQQQQQQQTGSLSRQNHLSPSVNQRSGDSPTQKASNHSTNSSRSNDSKRGSNPRRTDHERSRGGGGGGNRAERGFDRREAPDDGARERVARSKRTVKAGLKLPIDESLDVYESLSESPV